MVKTHNPVKKDPAYPYINILAFYLIKVQWWIQRVFRGLPVTFSLKKIYDELTEGIFDMSNVRIFKEVENMEMRDAYTLLCLRSAEFSKAFGLRNLCYSKISVVMLLWYMIAGISRKLQSERKNALCLNSAYLNS